MSEAIVITPVKDSPSTTVKTIEAICNSDASYEYYVFNDFSQPETKKLLEEYQLKYGFNLIHLEDITDTPPPNYKLVLQKAQDMALEQQKPLLIIESDVIVRKDTISRLLELSTELFNPALIGAITTDHEGKYNFPYNYVKAKGNKIKNTSHSLSFCCTLLTLPFLQSYSFQSLSQKKDWFDVTISRQAKRQGFHNYLAKDLKVLHLPHSSRPWKNLKYSNPLLYYMKKLLYKRDKI
jgi:GT2 family glycosyltransferase